MASLLDSFASGLRARAQEPGAAAALAFLDSHHAQLAKLLAPFGTDGELRDGSPLPASCFNDYYKFTMMPVMRAVERAKGEVRCTFSVNVRDGDCRRRLHQSATGKAPPELFRELSKRLKALGERPFDRGLFERCAAEHSLPGWTPETLDAVCGPREEPRTLVQEFQVDESRGAPRAPSVAGAVLLQVFVAYDERLEEERVFIEATGPWHRVTWLETSMMQAVYSALLQDQKRELYQVEDGSWYGAWLAEAFCRCVRSVEAAAATGLRGALFTGRRTGGLPLMLLQGLYFQHAFKSADGTSLALGSSSVTSRYWSLDAGIESELLPKCAGTHAHELSMVLGAILGEVDDEAGLPLSQIVGHLLYFFLSIPQADVTAPGRKVTMVMLPDTLGSRTFMETASRLKVPFGPHKGEAVLSVIGAARQDSGGLEAFKRLMDEFGYQGALMASEIETPQDLEVAAASGYRLFGAGGFLGDSEKAWDAGKKNISMASKVLRVYVNGERSPFAPVKTGETGDSGQIKEGKFEADGTLSKEQLAGLHSRAQALANAECKVDALRLQALLEEALSPFLGVASGL